MRPANPKTTSHFYRSVSSYAQYPLGRYYYPASISRHLEKSLVRHSSNQTSDPLDSLLAEPTWSVRSLLPPADGGKEAPEVTSEKLHHLLRLSALQLPNNAEEEAKMLKTLASQLHFVKQIQKVDTKGVTPLPRLQDETAAAEKENEISLKSLEGALNEEEVVGKHHKRIRRIQRQSDTPNEAENWDALSHAERKVGRYFVVDSSKP